MSPMRGMHSAEAHNALISKGLDPRRNFLQANTNIKKVEKHRFLGNTPDTTVQECLMALPCNIVTEDFIDETDSTTKMALAEIKTTYNVWLKFDHGDHCVTLSGESMENLNLAKDALQAFLLSINQDVQSKTIILTHHSIAATQIPVEIRSINTEHSAYRPFIQETPKETSIEEDLIDLSDGVYESDLGDFALGLDGQGPNEVSDVALDDLVNQFDAAVREAGKRLRPVAGELRVRAHMGVFTIKKRQTKQDKYQSDKELAEFLKTGANRGYVSIGHKLGNESWAARMLEIIYQTEDLNNLATAQFLAADPTTITIRDIKPRFTLFLFAKDLKIEVDVAYDRIYRPQPTATSVRAFSFSRDKVVEVATSCPKRKFDWHVSVEAESPASRIPAEIMDFLARGLKFKGPVSSKSEIDDDFPLTGMNTFLLRAASIDKVACKVFWTFQTAEQPYCLEVAVYHEWGAGFLEDVQPPNQWKTINTAATPSPIKSCGVSCYGQQWDEKMQEINRPGGGRQADFVHGFPDLFVTGDSAVGVEQFLQEMQRLHDFTELATVTGQS